MHILHYTTIYIYVNHFAVQQKLAQHCKSTILQFKKKLFTFLPPPLGLWEDVTPVPLVK